MRPTIEDGDNITIARVDLADVKPGDILLYRRHRRAIAHRVVDIRTTANEITALVLRGDAKAASDAPIAPEQVVGKVVAIERSGARAMARTWRAKLARLRVLAARWLPGGVRLQPGSAAVASDFSRTVLPWRPTSAGPAARNTI